jgi:DNA primase
LVVCTMNTGLKRRRRDNIFADYSRLPCYRTSASGFPQRARDTLVIPPPLDENGGERGPQERFQSRLVCAGEIDPEIGG